MRSRFKFLILGFSNVASHHHFQGGGGGYKKCITKHTLRILVRCCTGLSTTNSVMRYVECTASIDSEFAIGFKRSWEIFFLFFYPFALVFEKIPTRSKEFTWSTPTFRSRSGRELGMDGIKRSWRRSSLGELA